MKKYLENMRSVLNCEETKLLCGIFEPTVVTIPPSDACRNMCVTPDGEIRIYGAVDKTEPNDVGTQVFVSSNDCGLSWKTHLMESGVLGAAAYDPIRNRFVTTYPNEYRPELNEQYPKGTYAVIGTSFDDKEPKLFKICDEHIHILKLPLFLESRDRWLVFGEYTKPDYSDRQIAVFFSDDGGESWDGGIIGKSAPKHELNPPHKSVRWQQYSAEPTIVELSDGELLMFVRTSMDFHYSHRSFDGGRTWSEAEVTSFHGTITMPVLQKLSDGRIVFFWCNTQPLPEIDHSDDFPKLHITEQTGVWEDVFTNRDANHLAISDDDAKTWRGFRELFLSPIRNNSDFRSIGGANARDKSVHQAQILELPYNKLLIHFGQNAVARKVVIVDADWLLENSRSEDFKRGLEHVSTHMYVKSNLGGYKGFSGHCAYNRTNGALLVPDPSGNFREVLNLRYIEDDKLVEKKQGVVWNFPSMKKGRVEIELSVVGRGVRIALTDRWFNPCDEQAGREAQFVFDIDEKCTFSTVALEFDTENGVCEACFGDNKALLEMRASAVFGLSYLHLQTLATEEDKKGAFVRAIKAWATQNGENSRCGYPDGVTGKTKRLTLGSFRLRDKSDIVMIFRNEAVKKTYMLPDFKDDEAERKLFLRLKELSERGDRFVFCVRLGETAIGFINDVEISGDTIEMGYCFHPKYHGKGYCTEAFQEVIRYLFSRGFKEVRCGAFEENGASFRVMEKCGMERLDFTDEIEYRGKKHKCLYYSIKEKK